MMRATWIVLSIAGLAGVASRAYADERVLDYHVDLKIQPDGGLDVAEHIRVRAEGNKIRRGIYRDFPTRYEDRYGNRVVVELKVIGVERDDMPEDFFTESLANGVRINTGNDNFLRVPADYDYTIRYHTTRQLGFFADHDELYWNAIGTGWDFWIDQGTADVELPSPVPVDQMGFDGYTGYQGSKGKDFTAQATGPGRAHFALTRPLAAREGFTIVVSFPKGLVPEPTGAQRFAWFLHDNRGVLVALLGLLIMLAYCVFEWNRVGRDPRKGVIIPRYEPPRAHTPASLRFVMKMGYDMRCFSSDVLSLAVAHCLSIEREKAFIGRDQWHLDHETPQLAPQLAQSQQALLTALFPPGRQRVVLKNSNARAIQAVRTQHENVLAAESKPRYFKLNGTSTTIAFLIAAASIGLAVLAAGGAGVPALVAVGVVMFVALIVFAALVRAPTVEGRKLMDEIEGFKLYLSVAERDELARMKALSTAPALRGGAEEPAVLDAARYEQLLPFAVALEVEDAWTAKFTAAVGAAAAATAAAGMTWYRGGPIGDLGSFSKSVGDSLSSTISSAATPPGSSSGSGGGGSSGGGGGGGGGGGR
jgi:uncharacterized membrane protein YgcG